MADELAPQRLARLFEAVARQPWSHDFFALLRQIDALHPAAPRLGTALRPSAEPVRLGQDAELDFAPAAVMSFQAPAGRPPRLGVRFFGLFGPMGALPLHLTEYARDRQRNHADPTLVRFADLFHHRALLLFYRAWAQSQPTVQADRASDDRFAAWVGALAGLTPSRLQGRDAVPEAAKRYLSGHLSKATRNPEAMRKILVEYFDVPIRIESHVGHWMPLRREDQSRLGSAFARRSATLGVSSVAGSKVWDRQYKLRLHIGPLSLQQYRRFLPGQRSLIELRDWMRHLLGFEMLWDLRLELQASEVPKLGLGRRAGTAQPLGLSAWLGRKSAAEHRADLRLTPARIAAAAHATTKGDFHG